MILTLEHIKPHNELRRAVHTKKTDLGQMSQSLSILELVAYQSGLNISVTSSLSTNRPIVS